MTRIQAVADYVFYRIYSFYKTRKKEMPAAYALTMVTVIETLTVLNVIALIELVFNLNVFTSKYFLVPPFIIFFVANCRRYHQEESLIQELIEKWRNEPAKQAERNGWFVGLYLLAVIVMPILLGPRNKL